MTDTGTETLFAERSTTVDIMVPGACAPFTDSAARAACVVYDTDVSFTERSTAVDIMVSGACAPFTEISESATTTTYRLKKRLYEGRTAAGVQVLIADSDEYGRLLFLDGELQSASADEHLYHEALVHPAMETNAEVPDISVLVIGGGEGATVREVARWPNVAHIDWVDYDEELVALCQEHLQWGQPLHLFKSIRFLGMDIKVAFPSLDLYDVIIVDLPDPDGEDAYLYTARFWADLRAHLKPRGTVVSHCGPVRPWASIGDGYQRLRGVDLPGGRFYHQVIPSFQGEWGFIMWSSAEAGSAEDCSRIPDGVRVATCNQLNRWADLEDYWSDAISRAPVEPTPDLPPSSIPSSASAFAASEFLYGYIGKWLWPNSRY